MILYPAIDLMDGRCVRLAQGRFDDPIAYSADPVDAVLRFEAAGADWAHVVDLDGARAGAPRQHGLIADMALSTSLSLQVAGGVREGAHLKRLFDAGVDRVAIGSLAVTEPDLVRGFFDEFGPERIALALDVRIVDEVPMVAISGWTHDSGRSLWDVAADFPGLVHLLVTDIGRDGMLSGPNLGLIAEIVARMPEAKLQASGGVADGPDIRALAEAGATGAVVGKALWEGRVALDEALRLARA